MPIQVEHAPALARLMDVAFQGTIDHEGETLAQCEREMRDTILGKYGEFVSDASNLIFNGSDAVAACLISMWKGKPLLAFSLTDPKFQRRGLSVHLIRQAIAALYRKGEPVLNLVVTEGNTPAQHLYLKVGFKDRGPALPQTPPP